MTEGVLQSGWDYTSNNGIGYFAYVSNKGWRERFLNHDPHFVCPFVRFMIQFSSGRLYLAFLEQIHSETHKDTQGRRLTHTRFYLSLTDKSQNS